jgi:hypothetical protein
MLPPMPEAWSGAVVRAGVIAVWIVAFAVVTIAGVLIWSEWRTNVARFEVDLDPRPRVGMEEFPDAPPDDVTARVASAREGLAWVNRRFAVNGGACTAIGAGLIGIAVVYRRRRGAWPGWRTWALVLPLVAVLVALAVAWLATELRGAITG